MAAVALQLRSKHRNLRNPLIQLFSSSSSSNGGEDKECQSTQSISSNFSDVKASLKQSSQPQRIFPSAPKEHPSNSPLKHSNVASLNDIRKNLSEFRSRSSSPPPDEKASTQTISFDTIRESLRKFQPIEYVKRYNYEELGEKLRKLRPTTETKGNTNWFSLVELNERLNKLRELEAEEDSKIVGFESKGLRECLVKLRMPTDDDSNNSLDGLSILGHPRGTENLMLGAPKEELVEKHFYPDNCMSSEEKLKMELEKVQDELKMPELDCGYSLVPVTQLTTENKHLIFAPYQKFIQLSMLSKFLIVGILLSLNTILFTFAINMFLCIIISFILIGFISAIMSIVVLFCLSPLGIILAMGSASEPK